MTEEKKIDDKKPFEFPGDPFLGLLTAFANDGIGIGITISVGGLVVSGQTASGEDYFRAMGQWMADGVRALHESRGEDGTASAASLNDEIATLGDVYKRRKELPAEERKPLQFLHLRDARLFHNSGRPMPTDGGIWYRVRISQVDGFWLGSLVASSD